MTSLSMLIRALNEEAHIGRLLEGVFQQSRIPDEVILVDSGSTDATIEVARRFSNVEVVRIPSSEFSFGRALNRGLETTTADLVVIASAHVYPLQTSWLAELTAPFSDHEVALAYGRQVGDHRTSFSE